MRTFKYGSVVILALAVVASDVSAQARPGAPRTPATQQSSARAQAASTEQGFWEFGQDVGFSIGIDDPRSLIIQIPTGNLRAGYFMTPQFSLEPQLSFQSFAQENSTAISNWVLNLSGLWHFSTDRRMTQLFLHPGLAVTGGSGNGPSFTILNVTMGLKKPWMNNRLALRGEAGLAHRLEEGGIDAATSLVANVGFSVYTR